MKLKGNICTKVISSGVIAIQILANTFPSFGYSSLRNPEQYFNDFGKAKPSAVAYANKVIQETPDVHVLNLEYDKGVKELIVAQIDEPNLDLEEKQLTQEEFHLQIEGMGIDRLKKASEYTEEEIDRIVELLPHRFSDITGDEWYIRDLALMTSKGIINGVGDGTTFQGDRIVTRAEYWAMNGRLLGVATDNKENFEKYGFYYHPLGINTIMDSFEYHPRFIDMHKKWWFPYYYNQGLTIPFGLYSNEEMEMPVYRGEVALLTGGAVIRGDGNFEKIRLFSKVRYFDDLPKDFIPAEVYSQPGYKPLTDMVNELGFATGRYYPQFFKVVSGETKMTEITVAYVNYMNYAGIMCGFTDGTSGWNKELTRGEAIAVLARAFRPQQRLPLEQRIKDKSSLGLNVGQTEVSAELVKEVEKTISEGSGSDMTSGTDVLDTTKTPFDPSWNDEDKAWWFERRLGFYREVEDVYTALMMDHFDQLGIQDGSFKERHEQWTIFLKDVLKIEFNEEGLEKYIEYLLSTDVDVF
ncbi:MAG: hypothetical protein GX283_04655 [Clostridiaceae bacterium]|jgi:hypothetical protein|nr:hypothetical protein [Clostridiaceae bacterium]